METDRATLRLVRPGTATDPVTPSFGVRPALDRLNSVRLLSLDAHGRALRTTTHPDIGGGSHRIKGPRKNVWSGPSVPRTKSTEAASASIREKSVPAITDP